MAKKPNAFVAGLRSGMSPRDAGVAARKATSAAPPKRAKAARTAGAPKGPNASQHSGGLCHHESHNMGGGLKHE